MYLKEANDDIDSTLAENNNDKPQQCWSLTQPCVKTWRICQIYGSIWWRRTEKGCWS